MKIKTMVDTLPNNLNAAITSFQKYASPNSFREIKNRTEPDNGHRSEPLIKLDFKQESVRSETFRNWGIETVRAEDLVKAGFYLLNSAVHVDLVKCAFCNAEICNWETGDDPLEEHIRWSPNCPFAKEKYQSTHGSLPLSNQASGRDVCGSAEILTNSIPESETFRLLTNMVRNNEDEKTRLESFTNWPRSLKQKPEDLAEAGFYYRGVEDHAICFSCGGALRDWKDDDDPWEQHAMWFPRCRYLISKKGLEYVDKVQRKFKPLPINIEAKEKECENGVCEPSNSPPPDDGILRCKICDTNERNMIFIPCKHILACDECSRQFDHCPVCRKRISERVKVFLS